MRSFRFRYRTEGGHVHVRAFSGKAVNLTHGKNGDLVFDVEEWPDFLRCLATGEIDIVLEEEPVPHV